MRTNNEELGYSRAQEEMLQIDPNEPKRFIFEEFPISIVILLHRS